MEFMIVRNTVLN